MFNLSAKPLEPTEFKRGLASPKAGAFADFEGLVRDHNDGKTVTALEYEAFPELCKKEAEAIFREAREKFDIINAKCVHRVGKLAVGEMAVWVGVSASHREAAFNACQYIIDNVKTRLPIWKKEYYTDGASEWVNCGETCVACAHDDSGRRGRRSASPTPMNEAEYYSRQLVLPMVGKKGQEKLKKAKVLVVGAGGLGTPALQYLAGVGVGTIGICEYDRLDASNLHRQVLYSAEDVGGAKVELAVRRLKSQNPFIHFEVHSEKLSAPNVERIIRPYDVIVDGTDNFLAKYLLNDAAVLAKKPLVIGSVFQLEGQLRFINPKEKFSCLRCLWPEMPPAACTGSCVENGILGVAPGIVGTYEALEAIKFILGLPTLSSEDMLVFDLSGAGMRRLKISKDPRCLLCGKQAKIRSITAATYEPDNGIDVDLDSFSKRKLGAYRLVDIREPSEWKSSPVEGKKILRWPMSQIEKNKFQFDPAGNYLLFCGKGGRSHRLATELRRRGIGSVYSIKNGAPSVRAYLRNHVTN